MAFTATFSFAVIFSVPKRELVFCGLTGGIGWMFYKMIASGSGIIVASFVATLIITIISRVLAVRRKSPISVFLTPGIISLVPGAGIYNTMYQIIINENSNAIAAGLETLKIAGIIGVGVMVVLSLPRRLFDLFAIQ